MTSNRMIELAKTAVLIEMVKDKTPANGKTLSDLVLSYISKFGETLEQEIHKDLNDVPIYIDDVIRWSEDGSVWTESLISATDILTTDYPEPNWVVPGLIPEGLTFLAGRPKVGKSWLALQIAYAVATGGTVFGQKVEQGEVLYFALEDSPRRLKSRMMKQGWDTSLGNPLPADFLTIGHFQEKIGDLRNGGIDKIAERILARKIRFVVIDTLSRAIFGKQKEVEEMTEWLDPLQQAGLECHCGIVLNDHHRKPGAIGPDTINDILGSVAKSAVADTIMGIYKEQGKPGAVLRVIGREVEDREMRMAFDRSTGCWQIDDGSENLTENQNKVLRAVHDLGWSSPSDISDATGIARGIVYNTLTSLLEKQLVEKDGQLWGSIEKAGEQ